MKKARDYLRLSYNILILKFDSTSHYPNFSFFEATQQRRNCKQPSGLLSSSLYERKIQVALDFFLFTGKVRDFSTGENFLIFAHSSPSRAESGNVGCVPAWPPSIAPLRDRGAKWKSGKRRWRRATNMSFATPNSAFIHTGRPTHPLRPSILFFFCEKSRFRFFCVRVILDLRSPDTKKQLRSCLRSAPQAAPLTYKT